MKLTVELVPSSVFCKNVRSEVSKDEWDVIRRRIYKKADYRCEICNGRGDKWPVECHEVWEYDDETKNQKLSKMVALCPDCHEVKHMGKAQIDGRLDTAIEHLMRINNLSLEQANEYIKEAFNLWQERSRHGWKLDISILELLK